MPEYLAPGVYVEDGSDRSRRIAGVPTSTAAFIGATERGPLAPVIVGSVADFQRVFGAGPVDGYLPQAVAGFFENGGRTLVVCRAVGAQAATASARFGDFTLRAIGPGGWGERVWARIDHEPPAAGATAPRFRLRLAYWTAHPPGGLFDPFDPAQAARLAAHPPAWVEDEAGLDAQPGAAADYRSRLTGNDGLPRSLLAALRADDPSSGALPAPGAQALAGGHDDAAPLSADDIDGLPAGLRTAPQALAALSDAAFDAVSIVYAPAADDASVRRLIAHCEQQRYRLAIVEGPRDAPAPVALDPRTSLAASDRAAYYVPWLVVAGAGGREQVVPPGGLVAGIYARTDAARGVHTAPANELVTGVLRPHVAIDDGAQRILNPAGVNVIRSVAGRGVLVWGARTLSNDPQWRYVSVRRYLDFLEKSIERGTQWAVFEPNGEALWARVAAVIDEFLSAEWRNGALMGDRPGHAFFVRCDRSTMTQADIDNGRLICLIGVAPVRPAEFVIFRIVHRSASG